MLKVAIITDHVIFGENGGYYTSATVPVPKDCISNIYGRLDTSQRDDGEFRKLNMIPNDLTVSGYSLSKRGALGYFFSIFENVKNLKKTIKDNDVIILKLPYFSAIIAFFLARNKKLVIPLVIGYGENNLRQKNYRLFGMLVKMLVTHIINKSPYAVFVSHALKEHYEGKVTHAVIPEIASEKYSQLISSKKQKKENLPLVLTYVGRLSEEKGVMRLPAILISLKSKIHLNVIGAGPLNANLYTELLHNGIKFDFLGWVKNGPALFDALGKSDIVIIPSISEGYGISCIEAMLCGTVVVASNTGGLKDIIHHGVNGYLASSNREFTEIIDMLISDDKKRMRVANTAFASAVKVVNDNDFPKKLSDYINDIYNSD